MDNRICFEIIGRKIALEYKDTWLRNIDEKSIRWRHLTHYIRFGLVGGVDLWPKVYTKIQDMFGIQQADWIKLEKLYKEHSEDNGIYNINNIEEAVNTLKRSLSTEAS